MGWCSHRLQSGTTKRCVHDRIFIFVCVCFSFIAFIITRSQALIFVAKTLLMLSAISFSALDNFFNESEA